MTLNTITGTNRFCGPAVVSSLTGLSTTEIADKFKLLTGRNDIKAVKMSEIISLLNSLGIKTEYLPEYKGSLFSILSSKIENGQYLFNLPHHVIVIEVEDNKRYLIDNHTKSVLNAGNSARLGQNVLNIWKVIHA